MGYGVVQCGQSHDNPAIGQKLLKFCSSIICSLTLLGAPRNPPNIVNPVTVPPKFHRGTPHGGSDNKGTYLACGSQHVSNHQDQHGSILVIRIFVGLAAAICRSAPVEP